MPKLKKFFILLTLIAIGTLVYLKQEQVGKILAQTPYLQQIQSVIAQAKNDNQLLLQADRSYKNFVGSLAGQNNEDLIQAESNYNQLELDETKDDESFTVDYLSKTTDLVIARTEKYNALLYKTIADLQTFSEDLASFGIDNSDLDQKLEEMTLALGNVEANTKGLSTISQQLKTGETQLSNAMESIQFVLNQNRLEYSKVTNAVNSIINLNLGE